MKNQPLFVSIIIGIIVVFVIVGASLVAKVSSVSKLYHDKSLKNMELGKKNDGLTNKVISLEKDNKTLSDDKKTLEGVAEKLKNQIANDAISINDLKKLNESLENKLRDELIKSSLESKNDKSMKR